MLMADTNFLQQRKDKNIVAIHWSPTKEEEKAMIHDRQHIDDMYSYRAQFEDKWNEAAKKWNMLAESQPDSDMSNFVIPLSRMATHTGIVSMRQSLPEFGYIPGGMDDRKRVYLLREVNSHIDRMCNMEQVMDQFAVDFAVLGNGVLEDFVKVPYRTYRKEKLTQDGKRTGKYTSVFRRDWSKPKLGTRARSPWECAFDSNARNVSDIRACTFRDKISFDKFVEQYKIRPSSGDMFDYKNVDSVSPGLVYLFNSDGDIKTEQRSDEMVVIDNYQNEILDVWRVYANGILIWDVSLSSIHRHGKITLSLVPNHHKYDKGMRTHALYGAGDPELLEDLDDLVNSATNLYIDNMKKAQTNIVSIEGAGSLDVEEFDFTTGQVVPGKVNVQSLGSSHQMEWLNFKSTVEEWAIQIVKKNFKRLEGETAKTATEIMMKKQSENHGLVYQVKKMESSGIIEHAKKRTFDIMEHLTVDEWEDITEEDIDRIEGMVGEEIANEDIIYDKDTRKPIKVRFTEKFRTRGRVFDEIFLNGKRHIDGLRETKELRGQDGVVTASKEYLWTREYILHGQIPDVYIVGQSILGEDKVIELAKYDRVIQNLITFLQLNPEMLKEIDLRKLFEKNLDIIDISKEEVYNDTGNIDENDRQAMEKVKQIKALLTDQLQNVNTPQQVIPPPPTAENAPTTQAMFGGGQAGDTQAL